jgi:hypothetical protein
MEMNQTDVNLFVGMLASEIYRASRYKNPMTLMRIELGQPSRYAVRFVDRLLSERTRSIDFGLAIGQSEFLLCLPHTDTGGASVVANRLSQVLAEFEPTSTIAMFTDKGETLFELFAAVGASREARSALMDLEDLVAPHKR